jgi:hypothetical protein
MVITTPITYNKTAITCLIKGHEVINLLFFDYKIKVEKRVYPQTPDIDKLLKDFFKDIIVSRYQRQYNKAFELHVACFN